MIVDNAETWKKLVKGAQSGEILRFGKPTQVVREDAKELLFEFVFEMTRIFVGGDAVAF